MPSEVLQFSNLQPAQRQTVDTEIITMFENEAPTYGAFQEMEDAEINEGMVKLRMELSRPGGHGAWRDGASDFNEYVAPKFDAMYVGPTGYALPKLTSGSTIRGLMRNDKDILYKQADVDASHFAAATKRWNRMLQGDGSGRLAVSASALSVGTNLTLNCTTTASLTAGNTKGATFLEANHRYNAVDPATGTIRGTFNVKTPGASSAVVNVTAGTVASGDDIVDVNSYGNWPRGIEWLIDNTARILQTQNTGTVPQLNDNVIDLNGAPFTPLVIESMRTYLRTRNNSKAAGEMLNCLLVPGQLSVLRKQGYGFREYADGYNTVHGVAQNYSEEGIKFIEDADYEDANIVMWKDGTLKRYTEMPFGPYNLDGQTRRMLFGANSTGSDNYQEAIGCRMAVGKVKVRSAVKVKRAALPSETQVSAY